MKMNDKMAAQIRSKVEAKIREKMAARQKGEPASKREVEKRHSAIAGAILGGGEKK